MKGFLEGSLTEKTALYVDSVMTRASLLHRYNKIYFRKEKNPASANTLSICASCLPWLVLHMSPCFPGISTLACPPCHGGIKPLHLWTKISDLNLIPLVFVTNILFNVNTLKMPCKLCSVKISIHRAVEGQRKAGGRFSWGSRNRGAWSWTKACECVVSDVHRLLNCFWGRRW